MPTHVLKNLRYVTRKTKYTHSYMQTLELEAQNLLLHFL